MELYVFSHLINLEIRELWNHLSSLRKVVWEVSLELIEPGESESQRSELKARRNVRGCHHDSDIVKGHKSLIHRHVMYIFYPIICQEEIVKGVYTHKLTIITELHYMRHCDKSCIYSISLTP